MFFMCVVFMFPETSILFAAKKLFIELLYSKSRASPYVNRKFVFFAKKELLYSSWAQSVELLFLFS